jgi:hypothetical protein
MPDPDMSRLQAELQRLYLPQPPCAPGQDTPLIDDHGQVRALVLSLAGPADWALLARVWHGVQADLDLPAPAIAVAGAVGYQLWFSLADPVPAPQGLALLEALRLHYLGDVKAARVGLLPTLAPRSTVAAAPAALVPAAHAALVPARLPPGDQWSAFVSPDLAPVFADEPWLESAPNPAGQADLLSRLACMQAADVQRVLDQLRPRQRLPSAELAPAAAASTDPGAGRGGAAGVDVQAVADRVAEGATDRAPDSLAKGAVDPDAAALLDDRRPTGHGRGPRRFLLEVMNDPAVPLGLRIDAAKALLPYVDDTARP